MSSVLQLYNNFCIAAESLRGRNILSQLSITLLLHLVLPITSLELVNVAMNLYNFIEYVCLAGEHVYSSGQCVDVLVNV